MSIKFRMLPCISARDLPQDVAVVIERI